MPIQPGALLLTSRSLSAPPVPPFIKHCATTQSESSAHLTYQFTHPAPSFSLLVKAIDYVGDLTAVLDNPSVKSVL